MDNEKKADILIESLPYIQAFSGKKVVIKYSGLGMMIKDRREEFVRDITLLKYCGIRPILVHGGRTHITRTLNIFGKRPVYIGETRVTDQETAKISEMVLAGSISPAIVGLLNANGVPAVSVSGKDGHMIRVRQKNPDFGYVGEATKIDTSLLETYLGEDYVPVVTPISESDSGETYSLIADELAADLAIAMGAKKFILVTDADGIFTDPSDPFSFVSDMTADQARDLINQGVITRGMRYKVECCLRAIEGGISECHIINANRPHSILIELFTKDGAGTMIVAGE